MEHVNAEQALIGAILQKPDCLANVADVVKAEDFTCANARAAYIISMNLWRSKRTVDLVTVASENVSLASYLAAATSCGASIGVRDYANTVSMSAKERRLAAGLNDILTSKMPMSSRLDSLMRLYQQEMFISRKSPKIGEVSKRFSALQREYRKKKRLGFPTGFSAHEENYIQYVPGHIWMMGAWTSVGKTAMMVQKVCNLIAFDNCPSILIVSTEMTEEQMLARMLGNFTGVHPFRILSGNFRHGEEEVVEEYRKLIESKPVMMYDDIYEVSDIETVFRKADLQGGVDIGVIDYVQNCRVSDAANAYQEGSLMAKRLQQMAKDVRCCLLCLSQVSNGVGRGDTDNLEYKGAGEWSAVADVGIMLDRHKTEKHKLRYHVKKNRHGKLMTADFEYMADYTRLEEVY